MKVNVRVMYDKQEVVFEVPIGMGDKSFKWLGNVVCSRFSAAAPMGALRRRDDVRRGTSDRASHQAVEMCLADGQIPHPLALLYDFVQDGDEVKVHLVDSQPVNADGSGGPERPEWASLAYGDISKIKGLGENTNELENKSNQTVKIEGEHDHHYNIRQQNSRAQFVRILLKSQMINPALVRSRVEAVWPTVRQALPALAPFEHEMQLLVCEHWDCLVETFEYFSKTHTHGQASNAPLMLSQEGFYQFLIELNLFDKKMLKSIYVRLFAKACAVSNKSGSPLLPLSGLIISLMLCAQTKYNDTFSTENNVTTAIDGLKDIFVHFLPVVTERYEMRSMLKSVFISTHFLNQLREWHDELFAVFNKYAGRSRELPSSINYKDFTEALFDAGLVMAAEYDTKGNPMSFEHDTVGALLKQVHKGSIFGRSLPSEEKSSSSTSGLPDDIVPDNEFTYPEMVEAVCIQAFNKYRGTKPDEETGVVTYFDYAGDLTVSDCFVKGLVMFLQTLQKVKK